MIVTYRSKQLPISLIIPVHDEVSYLAKFLGVVSKLDPSPSEILVIKTLNLSEIDSLLDRCVAELHLEVRVFAVAGSFPGEARNFGVAQASFDWIAFLDAGVYPPKEWLASIWEQSQTSSCDLVSGSCRFVPDQGFPAMVCASSYGTKTIRAVLPGSLIARSIFDKVGFFPADARSGEDIAWFKLAKEFEIQTTVCESCILEYRHFEPSVNRALKKAFLYEIGARTGFRTFCLFGYVSIYPLALFYTEIAISCLISYLMARGVVDPLRRSGWGWGSTSQIVLMPLFIALLDAVKAVGHLKGIMRCKSKPNS